MLHSIPFHALAYATKFSCLLSFILDILALVGKNFVLYYLCHKVVRLLMLLRLILLLFFVIAWVSSSCQHQICIHNQENHEKWN